MLERVRFLDTSAGLVEVVIEREVVSSLDGLLSREEIVRRWKVGTRGGGGLGLVAGREGKEEKEEGVRAMIGSARRKWKRESGRVRSSELLYSSGPRVFLGSEHGDGSSGGMRGRARRREASASAERDGT